LKMSAYSWAARYSSVSATVPSEMVSGHGVYAAFAESLARLVAGYSPLPGSPA
jgi:hypothetical protein